MGKAFFLIFVLMLSVTKTHAHECQLEGNTAVQISRYNSCKADLAIENMHKPASENNIEEGELLRLRDENRQLRQKLELIKRQLLDLLSVL